MPNAALRPCNYPGCGALVVKGYCESHVGERPSVMRKWQYLYDTARWKRIRRMQLAREPWCADHLAKGEYVVATDVDHREPHRGDVAKFFAGPFDSRCKPCHSRKTAAEVNGRGGQNV